MTITRCDRCGKEMISMNDVFIVDGRPWNRPSQVHRMELCEWCFNCWLDWLKQEAQCTSE